MQNESKKLTKVEIAAAICDKFYPSLSQGQRDCWIHWVCLNFKREALVRHYNYVFYFDPIV